MNNTFAERLREALELRMLTPIELAQRSGISKASISEYLSGKYEAKQKNIYLMAQALRVSPAGLMGIGELEVDYGLVSIPILEKIVSGKQIITGDLIERYEMVEKAKVSFGLRSPDNSMAATGITTGDTVYVEQDAPLSNGDIVVALPAELDQAIIRRYFRYGGNVVLRSEGPEPAETTYAPKDVRLIGRVTGARISL